MIFPTVPAIYLQAFYEIGVWLYEIVEFGDEMHKQALYFLCDFGFFEYA